MRFLLLILISFILTFNCNAQDIELNNLDLQNWNFINNSECENNKYDVIWEFDSKINSTLVFSIKNNLIWQTNSGIIVNYTLTKDWKIIEKKNTEKFSVSFWEPWKILLEANISENWKDCVYEIKKEINIYNRIISFISDKNSVNLSFDDDFKKNNIFFNKLFLNNKSTAPLQDTFLSTLTEKLYIFTDSDIILVDSDSYLQILQWFEKIKSIYNVDFSNKKIYIVTDSSLIFSKKILNNFIESLNSKIYTFPTSNLLNFLNYLSTWKSSQDLVNNKNYAITTISYDPNSNKFLFLTNFTNKLISIWFPMWILGIIFALSLAVSLINFIRQFIGFSIFSLYYPIFIALSIYVFSLEMSIILIFSSFISIYLMKLLFWKTHFLVNTKLALYFISYLIISICVIWIFHIFNYIDFNDIKTNMIIFPFSIIPMVIYRVFADERKIFSWGFLFYVFEFLFVTYISYIIIKSNFVQNLFLAYSELILILFIINIFIWKFSWLQVLEYIRFIPLIKRNFNSEEE